MMKDDDIWLVCERHTMFEPLYYWDSKRPVSAGGFFPFLSFIIIGISVIALDHVAAFGIVMQATQGNAKVGLVTGMAFLLTSCYIQFFRSQRTPRMKFATVVLYFVSVSAVLYSRHLL